MKRFLPFGYIIFCATLAVACETPTSSSVKVPSTETPVTQPVTPPQVTETSERFTVPVAIWISPMPGEAPYGNANLSNGRYAFYDNLPTTGDVWLHYVNYLNSLPATTCWVDVVTPVTGAKFLRFSSREAGWSFTIEQTLDAFVTLQHNYPNAALYAIKTTEHLWVFKDIAVDAFLAWALGK